MLQRKSSQLLYWLRGMNGAQFVFVLRAITCRNDYSETFILSICFLNFLFPVMKPLECKRHVGYKNNNVFHIGIRYMAEAGP